MRYYAVLDTNVLVSALLKRNSVPATVLKHPAIIPLYSKEILEKYEDVLHHSKFRFVDKDIQEMFDGIKERGIMVDAESISDADFNDIDNIIFYEVIMEKRKTEEAWLVTGNIRHFPRNRLL